MSTKQQHSPEPWRNYAQEVVTDVMHSAVPNLSVAQRARAQAEEFHEEIARQADVIRAQVEQIADLSAQRERLIDALRAAEQLRPACLQILGYVPLAVLEYCNRARAALAGGAGGET